MDIHAGLIHFKCMKCMRFLILALVVAAGAVHAQNEQPIKLVAEIVIDVNADGGVVVEGKALELNVLAAKLKMMKGELPDLAVRIRGHVDAKYGAVIRVVDVCQKAGIEHISFSSRANAG